MFHETKQVFVGTYAKYILPFPLKSYNYGLELQPYHGGMSFNEHIVYLHSHELPEYDRNI